MSEIVLGPGAAYANRHAANASKLRLAGAVLGQAFSFHPLRALLPLTMAQAITPYPEIERQLVRFGSTKIVFEGVPGLGSLGHACTTFRQRNRLRAIALPHFSEPSAGHVLASRYAGLWDALHVLLGLDVSWTGQVAVASYVAAQRYCPQFEWRARNLAQLYITAAPWLCDALRVAERDGRRLGLSTPRLLLLPLEREWLSSLALLRRDLGIMERKELRPVEDASRAAQIGLKRGAA